MKKTFAALALLVPAGLMFAAAAPRLWPQSDVVAGATAPASSQALPSGVAAGTRDAAEQLLWQWSPHVQQVYGTAPERWARSMRPSLMRLSERELRRAAGMPSFDAMIAALTPQPQREIPAPSAWDARTVEAAQMLEAAPAQLVYNMLAPCRLADTRVTGTRLGEGGLLHLKTSGADMSAQGGHAGNCGVPADARAVVVNVVAVAPASAGYLTVFPYGTQLPFASSLNYRMGEVVGNEIIAKQADPGAEYGVSLYSYAGVDVVVDVVGYFSVAPQNALACFKVTQVFSLPPGNYGSGFAECPSTWDQPNRSARVGGGCAWRYSAPGDPEPGQLTGSLSNGGWYMCDGDNHSSKTYEYVVTAICCRVVPQ